MNKVVIYPGRFQPMLSHHAEVYRQLQQSFPDADVYIGTSDKVDGDKSPFNFEEKKLIAQAHGIDPSKVLQVRSPYNASGYDFDPENTVLIFAVGEKDLDRFPFSNVDPGTGLDMTVKGEPKPKYLQKLDTIEQGALPMSQRGYVTLAPTVKTGDEIASASAFRQQLKDAPDVEAAKQVYTKQFGEYNDKIFDLIYNKIVGTNMSEQLNYMRQLAGLPVEEGAPVNMAPGYTMSDADRALAEIGRLIMDMANQRPMGKGVPESELELQNKMSEFGGALADGRIESTQDLIAAIKDAGSHAKALSDVTKQAMADYAAGKKADVKGEEVPDEPEDQEDDMMDSVDLSDIRAEYGIEEEGIEDQVCSHCDGSGCEECDDVGGNVEEGDVVNFPGTYVKKEYVDVNGVKMLKDVWEYMSQEREIETGKANFTGEEDPKLLKKAYQDELINFIDEFEDQDMDPQAFVDELNQMAENFADGDVSEAVEETSTNAMQAAMAELRKLAGI